jgi:tetratricopeptide (TPR) repeat protein
MREEPLPSMPPIESAARPMNEPAQPAAERTVAPKREPALVAVEKTNDAKPVAVAAAPVNGAQSAKAAALSRAIEILVAPQTTFQERRAVLKQLRESGQVDEAIEAVKQGAAENPNSAAYPLALGELELQKADILARTGGTISQMGMAGMSADQSFDDALKLDPSNWEAQFSKAAAMSYWPAELNKGPEVTQRLLNLIDQQESMPSQPQFAQSYVLLGDQYQKAGQTDYASHTWQLGAQRFPADPTLRARVAGLQNY